MYNKYEANKIINVLIGIQARSGSKRLPGKTSKILNDKAMVNHVLERCHLAASYLNRVASPKRVNARVCLLIPKDDPLKEMIKELDVIEGPEDDVLARYELAMKEYNPDYLVRITGDCPLIIPTIISKHVVSAIATNLDYCSNAYEDLRTFVDGYDVEIISRKAFEWVCAFAQKKEEIGRASCRERV